MGSCLPESRPGTATLREMVDIGAARLMSDCVATEQREHENLHQDVGRVLLHGLNAYTAASGAVGVEVSPVISAEDKGVSVGVGEVLR